MSFTLDVNQCEVQFCYHKGLSRIVFELELGVFSFRQL